MNKLVESTLIYKKRLVTKAIVTLLTVNPKSCRVPISRPITQILILTEVNKCWLLTSVMKSNFYTRSAQLNMSLFARCDLRRFL